MLRSRVAGALAVLLVSTAGCATKPLVDHPDPKGRTLVLLLDASASMRENDPGRADVVGATLACALAGTHDNVGVLAYDSVARVVAPVRAAGDASVREAFRNELRAIDREGSTDFDVALDAALSALEESKAPPGSSVILLTDGLPSPRVARGHEFSSAPSGPGHLPAAVAKMAARSWRIFAIVLGPEAPKARSYMTRLVAPTGGAVVEALGSNALVDAFEQVAIQALGYLAGERLSSQDSLSIPPDVRRIAFVAPGLVGPVARDKQAIDPARTIAFPRSGAVAVSLLEDPEPGSYQVDSGPTKVLALVDPSWYLEFEKEAPAPSVPGGSTVPVLVTLKGDESSVLRVRDRIAVSLEVASAGKLVAQAPLARPDKSSVRFEGSFVAPDKEDVLTVTTVATIVEGGKTFASRRAISISVKKGTGPSAPLKVEASPGELALAGFPEDDLSGEIALSCSRAASLRVEASAGFSAAPSQLDLAPGAPSKLVVRVSRDAKGGTIEIFDASNRDGRALAKVPVRVERGTLGTSAIDLGSVMAGDTAEATIDATLVTLVCSPLEGPSGSRVELAASGMKLIARTPASTPPGTYSGEVQARCGTSSRELPVKLEVRPAVRVPESLELEASWGWASVAFDLGAKATFEPGALVRPEKDARIDPELDMRTVEVGPGRYELRVFAAATLPPGRYSGTLRADVGGHVHAIPVTLEVKR